MKRKKREERETELEIFREEMKKEVLQKHYERKLKRALELLSERDVQAQKAKFATDMTKQCIVQSKTDEITEKLDQLSKLDHWKEQTRSIKLAENDRCCNVDDIITLTEYETQHLKKQKEELKYYETQLTKKEIMAKESKKQVKENREKDRHKANQVHLIQYLLIKERNKQEKRAEYRGLGQIGLISAKKISSKLG